MADLKDLDMSHITTLHLTIVERGAIYIDSLASKTDEILKIVQSAPEQIPQLPEPKDYSQSQFRSFLAQPEFINRTMTWLHLHIDNQKDSNRKVKPLRALTLHKIFTAPIPHEVFVSEFGEINQGFYSKCIGGGNNYDDNEVQTLFDSYEKFDYDNFLKHPC